MKRSCPDLPEVCDCNTYLSPEPNGQVIEGGISLFDNQNKIIQKKIGQDIKKQNK